jgi:hypothetical protein
MKLNKQMIQKIGELRAKGFNNIEICKTVLITEPTFYSWLRQGANDFETETKSLFYDLFCVYNKSFMELQDTLVTKLLNSQDTKATIFLLQSLFGEKFGIIERKAFKDMETQVNQLKQELTETKRLYNNMQIEIKAKKSLQTEANQ